METVKNQELGKGTAFKSRPESNLVKFVNCARVEVWPFAEYLAAVRAEVGRSPVPRFVRRGVPLLSTQVTMQHVPFSLRVYGRIEL